jgi:hypothetical protein
MRAADKINTVGLVRNLVVKLPSKHIKQEGVTHMNIASFPVSTASFFCSYKKRGWQWRLGMKLHVHARMCNRTAQFILHLHLGERKSEINCKKFKLRRLAQGVTPLSGFMYLSDTTFHHMPTSKLLLKAEESRNTKLLHFWLLKTPHQRNHTSGLRHIAKVRV